MNRLKIVCFGILVLLLIATVGIAQLPNESTEIMRTAPAVRSPSPAPSRILPPPYPVIPLIVGNGFAFSGKEFHVVKINVVGMRRIPVQDIRPMIAEGKNLSQIKEALIRPEGVTPVWKGHMKFGERHYILNVTELDKKHIKAEILAYPVIRSLESNSVNASIAAFAPKAVGSLNIEIKLYEGAITGTGKITFNSENPDGTGEYDVYLYVSPDRPYIEPLLKPMITSNAKENE